MFSTQNTNFLFSLPRGTHLHTMAAAVARSHNPDLDAAATKVCHAPARKTKKRGVRASRFPGLTGGRETATGFVSCRLAL